MECAVHSGIQQSTENQRRNITNRHTQKDVYHANLG